MKRFLQMMNPSVTPDIEKEMDVISLRNIYMISLIALVFKLLAGVTFLASQHGRFD